MSRPDVLADARLTSHMSAGMRLYARELLSRLPLAASDLRVGTFAGGDNFDVREQLGIPLEIARRRPRLVHFMSPFTPFAVPAPFVVTVHDLIDLRYPQFGKAKVQPYYRYFVRSVLARAARVITDDPRTAADLQALLGVAAERIRVIPLGVEAGFGDDAVPFAPPRPYVFYAGNHRPHKDLGTLFAAWHALPPGAAADVYVTGADDFGAALEAYRRDDAEIVVLGDVTRERLAGLYRGAAAYVHPALLEGFGLPILEAAWCGTPVVAARSSVPAPLRDCVLTFEPGDAAGLRALLERVLLAPGETAARAAVAQSAARRLTWERTASSTVAVYRELLRG